MKLRLPSPAVAISSAALLLAAGGGGTAIAATNWNPTPQAIERLISHSTAGNATHFDGLGPRHFVRAQNFATSGGDHFRRWARPSCSARSATSPSARPA